MLLKTINHTLVIDKNILLKKFLFLFILFLAIHPFGLQAQQTVQKFVMETNYLLYLPDGYNENSSELWPLLIFLHGSGSSGSDIEKVKRNGIPALIENGKKFPFIVISPQSPEHGWNVRDIRNLLMSEINKYKVDTDRIYLTGLSMGGKGTWELAITYPEFFAAIIPICGDPDESAIENVFQLRHTPVWCFHGAEDENIDPSFSKNIVDALKKYNPDAKLTIYPGVGHNSWTITYNNDSIYQWLLQHTRYVNKEIEIDESILKEYSSYKYSIPGHGKSQVASFTVEDGGLCLWIDNNKGALIKSATEDTFFQDTNSRKYIIFEKDSKGAISGLTLYEYGNKIFCKRMY